jgi:hypothetical protein
MKIAIDDADLGKCQPQLAAVRPTRAMLAECATTMLLPLKSHVRAHVDALWAMRRPSAS